MKYHVYFFGEKIASFKRKGDSWTFCKTLERIHEDNNRPFLIELYENKKFIKAWEA